MLLFSRIPGFQKQMKNKGKFSGPDKEVHKRQKVLRQEHAGHPVLTCFHGNQTYLDFSSLAQAPTKTTLQKYLRKGEYPSFKYVAMFESTFVQVTRRGRHILFHNHANEIIIAIASTNTELPLPNLMFIARLVVNQVSPGPPIEEPKLTRLLPLKFVRLSVHDPEKHIIKIKLINGRSYYLQLHPSTKGKHKQFQRWRTLIYLLHHPPPCYFRPKPTSYKFEDNLSIKVIPSDEEAVQEESKDAPLPKEKKQETSQTQKKIKKQEKSQTQKEIKKQETSQTQKTKEKEEHKDQKEKGQPSRISVSANKSKYTVEEEYTKDEMKILEGRNSDLWKEWYLYKDPEIYEAYHGSHTTRKQSRTFSSTYFLSDLCSESTSSSTITPPPPRPSPVFPVPKKGENGSLNIVTIYSAVSKTLSERSGENKN